MYVIIVMKGGEEVGVLGEVRHHAEIDLGIITAQQQGAIAGDKGFPHLLAQLSTNGDVLQVGVAGGEPPGGGARLVEAGMHPVGFRVDQGGEDIDIGGLQLR